MRVTRPGVVFGSAMISCVLFAGVADAQNGKAPRINLTTALGHSVVANYIEPAVTLSEDAYVFVIAVDVDRNVQVLHPAETGISVKMAARRQLHLPRFFAGYHESDRFATMGMGHASYDAYGPSYSDSRGTMIALASRKPFNLSAISVGGDWDLELVRHLVEERDPHSAAIMLAKLLGARGEPIGRDVYRFAGGRRFYNAGYSSAASYGCGLYSGGLGYARGFGGHSMSFFRAAQFQQAGYLVGFRGYDVCGQPIFDVYPQAIVGTPPPRPPAVGAFPPSRLPSTAPRNPAREGSAGSQVANSRPGATYTDRAAATTPPARRIPTAGSDRNPSRPQPVAAQIEERRRAREVTRPSAPERVYVPRHAPERVSAPVTTTFERPAPPPAPRVEHVRPTPPDPKPVDG